MLLYYEANHGIRQDADHHQIQTHQALHVIPAHDEYCLGGL